MAIATIEAGGNGRAAFRPFARDALELAVYLAVVPNLLFLLAMPLYIAERLISPLFYVVAGLLALVAPRWLGVLLFLIAAMLDIGLIVSAAFHLKPTTAFASLGDMATIDVAASAFYLGFGAAVMGAALLAAALVARRRAVLRGASPLPSALLAGLLMLLDAHANLPYVTGKAEGLAFQSALGESGLTAGAVAARGNNLLIVMVEGLGAFKDPAERAVLTGALERAAGTRFRFERGTSNYFGSTTGGESRELCGRWGDHRDYLQGRHDCLPRRLAARGYEAVAYHGFKSKMFERDRWYPNIGFTRAHFADDIARAHAAAVPSRCGSVFSGLCDVELAALVKRELLAPSERPKFVYWLTLNSHIPYLPKRNGTLGCAGDRPRIANRTVCELSEYWAEVMNSVAAIASDPALPPTDILVIGDHHTPLWERAAKNRFVLSKVDWYLLRHKN